MQICLHSEWIYGRRGALRRAQPGRLVREDVLLKLVGHRGAPLFSNVKRVADDFSRLLRGEFSPDETLLPST